MNRRIDLPEQDQVRQAMNAVIAEATGNGHRPTVIALARKLGLDNATFRRHFPEIVRELREEARTAKETSDGPTRFEQLEEAYARLERDHARQAGELHEAQAVIQRLALENQHLRQQADGTGKILPFSPARPRSEEEVWPEQD